MRAFKSYFVPDADEHCLGALLDEVGDLGFSLDVCKDFRTVIQAGGNIGVYPLALSQRFKVVYTVEPDVDNFEALEANTCNAKNIVSSVVNPRNGRSEHAVPIARVRASRSGVTPCVSCVRSGWTSRRCQKEDEESLGVSLNRICCGRRAAVDSRSDTGTDFARNESSNRIVLPRSPPCSPSRI